MTLTLIAHHAVGAEAALEAAVVALLRVIVRDRLARLLAGRAARPVLAAVLAHHRCENEATLKYQDKCMGLQPQPELLQAHFAKNAKNNCTNVASISN